MAGSKPSNSAAISAFLVVDEGEQFVAGDAVRFGGPISPAIRRFDGRFVK